MSDEPASDSKTPSSSSKKSDEVESDVLDIAKFEQKFGTHESKSKESEESKESDESKSSEESTEKSNNSSKQSEVIQ